MLVTCKPLTDTNRLLILFMTDSYSFLRFILHTCLRRLHVHDLLTWCLVPWKQHEFLFTPCALDPGSLLSILRQVSIRRNHRKSEWERKEDEKTSDNILKSATPTTQQEVSKNTVFSSAWKGWTRGIPWSHSDSGERHHPFLSWHDNTFYLL